MARDKGRVKSRVFNIVASVMKYETPAVTFRPGVNCSDTYWENTAPDYKPGQIINVLVFV